MVAANRSASQRPQSRSYLNVTGLPGSTRLRLRSHTCSGSSAAARMSRCGYGQKSTRPCPTPGTSPTSRLCTSCHTWMRSSRKVRRTRLGSRFGKRGVPADRTAALLRRALAARTSGARQGWRRVFPDHGPYAPPRHGRRDPGMEHAPRRGHISLSRYVLPRAMADG